jgi:hypothetical protein
MLQASLPCQGCGTSCNTYTATSGTITDGSGSSTYPNNANCRWIIAPGAGFLVTITFSEFATEYRSDFVYVSSCTNSSCATTTQLAALSGSPEYISQMSALFRGFEPAFLIPWFYTSTTGFMLVTFTSDDYEFIEKQSGWSASWTAAPSTPVRS